MVALVNTAMLMAITEENMTYKLIKVVMVKTFTDILSNNS